MKDEENKNMNKEKIHRTKTSKIHIKIKITNVDEEEYECMDDANKNNFDISSSFSPKSRKGQINNIKLKKDNDKNSNSENQKNLFNFTNKLYLSEEHLNQKKIVKKKNASQYNLPKLKKYLSVHNFNKYDDIKTSNSKQNSNRKYNLNERK